MVDKIIYAIFLYLLVIITAQRAVAQEEVFINTFLGPDMLIKSRKIPIPDAGDYYSYGYEFMPGSYYASLVRSEIYENRVELYVNLLLRFSDVTRICLYRESYKNGFIENVALSPDPELNITATVTADVYIDDKFLGNYSWGFSSPIGNCKSFTWEEIIITNEQLQVTGGAVSKISGFSKEQNANLFKRLKFMNMQITSFKQGLPPEFVSYVRKKYADEKKAEAEAKKAAEEKKLAEAAEKKAQDQNDQQSGQNSSDLAATATTSQKNTTTKSEPKVVMSTQGPYRIDENGKYHKITNDEYDAAMAEISKQKNEEIAAQNKRNHEETLNKQMKDYQSYNRQVEAQAQRVHDNIIYSSGKLHNSFYAAQAAKDAKNNMKQLTQLDDFDSPEALEAAFRNQMSAISDEANILEQQSRQSFSSFVDAYSYNGNSTDAAIGEAAKIVGNITADIKANNEEKRRKEELRVNYEKKMAEIAEKKRLAHIKLREGVLEKFSDGGIPLSSHKVEADKLYFFVYTIADPVNADNPLMQISNVFSISRFGDGGWPFRSQVASDINKLAIGKQILMGYYTTEDLANGYRSSLINLAGESKFRIEFFSYKGKSTANHGVSGDFWETNTPASTPVPGEKNNQDDFWNN